MKAWMIKNKDGEYCDCCLWAYESILDGDIYKTKEKAEEDAVEWNKETDNVDKFEVVEITMVEGNLEEENRALKSNLYEIWHSFATICEVCVTESKKEISSENAVEEIRNYLTGIDLCFDEIEEKLGTDYFIKQSKGDKL